MKLYNKTKCPDQILKPLLVTAGRSIGARTTNVVVKVTQGHYARSKGHAYEILFIYSWHLRGRRNSAQALTRDTEGRMINTDGGFIEITLPGPKDADWFGDPIKQAEEFYGVAQHEWAHIKDFQDGKAFSSPRTLSGRRLEWAYRPIEISACNQVRYAKEMDIDDMILELALYLESKET